MSDIGNDISGMVGAAFTVGVGMGVMRATTRMMDDDCPCNKRKRQTRRRGR